MSEEEKTKSDFKKQYTSFRRIDKTPLTWYDFFEPMVHAAHPCVMLPTIAYAMEFLWTSIMVTVEIPQLFPVLFGFNTQQNGLQMIAIIIGTIIGEQMGGRMSDAWMLMRRRKLGGLNPNPEFRLWLSYFGFALCIIGIVVFLVSFRRCLALNPFDCECIGSDRCNRFNCIMLVLLGTSLRWLALGSALRVSRIMPTKI